MSELSKPEKLSAEDLVALASLELARQIAATKDPVEKARLEGALTLNLRVSLLQASERRIATSPPTS